jgi:hypothetical protein
LDAHAHADAKQKMLSQKRSDCCNTRDTDTLTSQKYKTKCEQKMLSHSCLSPSLAHVSSRSSVDISLGAHIVKLNSHAECPQRRGRPQARPTAFESTQQACACKILHRNFRGSAQEKLCVAYRISRARNIASEEGFRF